MGFTPEDNAIIAVYTASPRNVTIYCVDEHDLAYETLIERG